MVEKIGQDLYKASVEAIDYKDKLDKKKGLKREKEELLKRFHKIKKLIEQAKDQKHCGESLKQILGELYKLVDVPWLGKESNKRIYEEAQKIIDDPKWKEMDLPLVMQVYGLAREKEQLVEQNRLPIPFIDSGAGTSVHGTTAKAVVEAKKMLAPVAQTIPGAQPNRSDILTAAEMEVVDEIRFLKVTVSHAKSGFFVSDEEKAQRICKGNPELRGYYKAAGMDGFYMLIPGEQNWGVGTPHAAVLDYGTT